MMVRDGDRDMAVARMIQRCLARQRGWEPTEGFLTPGDVDRMALVVARLERNERKRYARFFRTN
jgi:hypothetical protein